MCLADANGTLLYDPVGVYAFGVQIVTGGPTANVFSILNADAALIVDVLAVWSTSEVNATVGSDIGPLRLQRITAHSAGTAVTPIVVDSTTGALDADITVFKKTGAGALTVSATGEMFKAHMVHPPGGGGGLLGGGKVFLWNHMSEGAPIVCRQNEGLVVLSANANFTANEAAFGGMLFRVR